MDVKINNLYQSPNYVALMVERGEGNYDINWDDKNQVFFSKTCFEI